MNINLNDEQYTKVGGDFKIFNDGLAGVTENVTLAISRRGKDEKDTLPDYKITFTDESGSTVNTSFYYIKEATQYKTIEQQVKSQGQVLVHLVHAIVDPAYKFPAFGSSKELLDGCIKIIKAGIDAAPKAKYRIFTNYGSTKSPKTFLQPRSWVPFIENASVSIENSRLEVSKIDQMSRLAPDEKPASGNATSAGHAGTTPNDEDWD